MLRDHRNEILRTLLGALGGGSVLAAAGWPEDLAGAALTLIGLSAGVLVAFVAEALLDREGEVAALRERVRELEEAAEQYAEERKLWEYQLALAQREAAVNGNSIEVWGGAYSEAMRTGHLLPVAALMARLEMTSKAKGLDEPIPKP